MSTKTKTKRRHPNQRGTEHRVRLNGGPWVDPTTLATMARWNAAGVSYGALIDRLAAYAVAHGYDPTTTQPK